MRQPMPYHIFNTHEYIKALTKAGMQENLAEIVTKGILESREHDFSKLATKDQLGALASSTREQIAFLNARMDSMNDSLNARMDSMNDSLNARMDSMNDSLNARMDAMNSSFNERMDFMNMRIDSMNDSLSSRIDFIEKKLDKCATKEEMNSLRSDLKSDIATSQNYILKWMVPLFLAVISMVATVMFKILSH